MARKRLLEKLEIVKHSLRNDLVWFFVPWLASMLVILVLCGTHGDGLTRIWQDLWELVTHPNNFVAFPLQRTLGLSLLVCGLSIMLVGQTTLWNNYSGFVVIKKNHQLVTHGIYRYTRNPIYLGAIIGFAGLPTYAASVYGLLAIMPQIAVFVVRIKMEEELLAEHFGAEYKLYLENTRRLIPFFY